MIAREKEGADRREARTTYIDFAKGILIVLVVFGHAWRAVYNNGFLEDTRLYHLVDDWIYAFHMPAFFFISGLFALQSSRRPVRQFVLRKLQTIAYPYLVWSLIQSCLQLAMSEKTTSSVSLQDILRIPVAPVMQFWFLYALFFIFLVFILVRQVTTSRVIFLALGVVLFGLMRSGYLPGYLPVIHVSRNFIYFSLGIFCSHFLLGSFVSRSIGRGQLLPVIVVLFAASLSVFVLPDVLPPGVQTWMEPFLALPGLGLTLSVALLLVPSTLLSRGFALLGKRSLEIFVAHTIFSAGFRITVSHIFGIQSLIVHLAGATLAGLIGPLLVYMVMERIGFRYLFVWPVEKKGALLRVE